MTAGVVVVLLGIVVAYFVAAAVSSGPSRWRFPRGFGTFLGWLPRPSEGRRMRDLLDDGQAAEEREGD
jgi:hypothetical protein